MGTNVHSQIPVSLLFLLCKRAMQTFTFLTAQFLAPTSIANFYIWLPKHHCKRPLLFVGLQKNPRPKPHWLSSCFWRGPVKFLFAIKILQGKNNARPYSWMFLLTKITTRTEGRVYHKNKNKIRKPNISACIFNTLIEAIRIFPVCSISANLDFM